MSDVCGVSGVHAGQANWSRTSPTSLTQSPPRPGSPAGLAVSDGDTLTVVKDMGLVSHAFDGRLAAAALDGDIAVGHTRYSMAGSSSWWPASPLP